MNSMYSANEQKIGGQRAHEHIYYRGNKSHRVGEQGLSNLGVVRE